MNVNLAPGLSDPLNLENSTMAPVVSQNNVVRDNVMEWHLVMLRVLNNHIGTNNLNELQDWRNVFFEKMDCKGVVINAGAGDVVVQGEVKSKTSDPTIMFGLPIHPLVTELFRKWITISRLYSSLSTES